MLQASKNTLDEYLKNHITKTDIPYTHTRIGSKELDIRGGSYYISENDLSNFWNIYYKHVFETGKKEYLTERQLVDNGPVLIDIDERYDISIKERQHTKDHIIDLIMLYVSKFKDIYDINKSIKIPVWVMEKHKVNITDEKTKDGIHIIIGLKMHKALQLILRDKVINDIPDMWDDLPLTNSWEELIDEAVTKGSVNWQIFGSRKPNNKAYQLKYYFTVEYNINDIEEEKSSTVEGEWEITEHDVSKFNIKENIHKLSARYTEWQVFDILDSIKTDFEERKKSLLNKDKKPKFSVKTQSQYDLNHFDYTKIKDSVFLDQLINSLFDEDNIRPTDYELKEIHQFTMILPKSYYGAGSYNKWIRVGWALKNTDKRLFLSWLKLSSKSPEFKWSEVPDLYNRWLSFDHDNPDGLTNRSIMFWAKNDALQEYNAVRKDTISYFMDQTINTSTEFDLANVLYQIFKDVFVCVSIKNNVWYEYIKHRWHEIDSGNTLRLLISKKMHDMYLKKAQDSVSALSLINKDDEADHYERVHKRGNRLSEICTLLKKTTWKNNIMREARELFYDKNFLNKLDTNPYLLCFNNFVIDFKNKIHRIGQPDDYISKCTNIDYTPLDYKRDSQVISEIEKFINEIFPDKTLRKYMWEHLASCLIGTNENQTFNIYTGSGCNGKSKLVELMSKAMGDYKATVPITLITQSRTGIGNTSSEVVQLMGVRYAVMQEPSKGDKINEGIMKEITGGDPIQGRALFKEAVTFIPQFKLVVCTNALFDIKSNDDGTWRRIRVCDFASKFLENPNEDQDKFPIENYPYQYKIDKKIDEKFNDWAPIFISMLVNLAFETQGHVKDCKSVLSESDKYREGQDYLAEFAKDRIQRKNDAKIKKTEILEEFRSWYSTHYGRNNIPNGREITDYMDKRFGKCNKGKWHNVALVYDDDDDDIDL